MPKYRALMVTTALAVSLLGGAYLAPIKANAAAKPIQSLAGEWIADVSGTTIYYDFDPAGKKSFNGYVVGLPCVEVPGDIRDTAKGNGHYTGTEDTFTSFAPCVRAGTATNTIQLSANGRTAQWDSQGCSNCGPQSWTRATPVWGFDTSQPATAKFLAEKAVADLGHPRFVGQYLEDWQGAHDVITPAAVKAIHAARARIMLIANPKVARNALTTAKQAIADAEQSVATARKLHAPRGTAIFRDVESYYHINAPYVIAWVATVTKNGYVAGFYENPRGTGALGFTTAYCRAAQSKPAIPGQTFLFSDEPEPGTSREASKAPQWSPESPILGSCASRTIAWQYLINPKRTSPNIDDDETLPGDLRYFW